MATAELDPIKKIKESFFGYIGTVLGVIIIGAVVFYFNTQAMLSELRIDVSRNSASIELKASQDELKELKAMVREDMQSIRQDIKEVRDDNKKILEILSEK